MKKIMKKVPVARKIVTRSIARALRHPAMNLKRISSFVVIHRNNVLERLVLNQRNVRRIRRASEADALPNEQNGLPRRRRRRASFDSALVRKRRNSISIQQNPIPDAPKAPLIPFDHEFVQRLNRIAGDEQIVNNDAEQLPMEINANSDGDDVHAQPTLNEPVKESCELVKENIQNDSNLSENEFSMGEIEATTGKVAEALTDEVSEDVVMKPFAKRFRSLSVDKAPEKQNHKPLPAPFNIRGRRPSTGARLMEPIHEE